MAAASSLDMRLLPRTASAAITFVLAVALLPACGGGTDEPAPGAGSAPVDTRPAPDTGRQTSDAADGSGANAAAPEHAAEVIRSYYASIAAGEYERAYRLWSGNGAASGQTLEEFARGFAQTTSVEADVGGPTQPEGAAGSVYVKVPVVVRAVTTDGERQHFEGTYTLRRINVDGASPEQRAWRIYDAAISATGAPGA